MIEAIHVQRKSNRWYCLADLQEKLDHFMYMDDLKSLQPPPKKIKQKRVNLIEQKHQSAYQDDIGKREIYKNFDA